MNRPQLVVFLSDILNVWDAEHTVTARHMADSIVTGKVPEADVSKWLNMAPDAYDLSPELLEEICNRIGLSFDYENQTYPPLGDYYGATFSADEETMPTALECIRWTLSGSAVINDLAGWSCHEDDLERHGVTLADVSEALSQHTTITDAAQLVLDAYNHRR